MGLVRGKEKNYCCCTSLLQHSLEFFRRHMVLFFSHPCYMQAKTTRTVFIVRDFVRETSFVQITLIKTLTKSFVKNQFLVHPALGSGANFLAHWCENLKSPETTLEPFDGASSVDRYYIELLLIYPICCLSSYPFLTS